MSEQLRLGSGSLLNPPAEMHQTYLLRTVMPVMLCHLDASQKSCPIKTEYLRLAEARFRLSGLMPMPG